MLENYLPILIFLIIGVVTGVVCLMGIYGMVAILKVIECGSHQFSRVAAATNETGEREVDVSQSVVAARAIVDMDQFGLQDPRREGQNHLGTGTKVGESGSTRLAGVV